MSEENEEGTFSSIKKTVLGTLATVITAGGAWLGSTLFGGGSEEAASPAAAPAPVINITNTQTQQQSTAGKTVIIKEPAKPAAPKKKTEKEQLEEAPAW
jgi:hypothetical protein